MKRLTIGNLLRGAFNLTALSTLFWLLTFSVDDEPPEDAKGMKFYKKIKIARNRMREYAAKNNPDAQRVLEAFEWAVIALVDTVLSVFPTTGHNLSKTESEQRINVLGLALNTVVDLGPVLTRTHQPLMDEAAEYILGIARGLNASIGKGFGAQQITVSTECAIFQIRVLMLVTTQMIEHVDTHAHLALPDVKPSAGNHRITRARAALQEMQNIYGQLDPLGTTASYGA
ncbi:MAG: hypothetical protein ACOZAO_05350 [Patescibacteria group bacterium]